MKTMLMILMVAVCAGGAAAAWADCSDSPLRCVFIDDKGEKRSEGPLNIGQCSDGWSACKVCGGCDAAKTKCAQTFHVPKEKVVEANANGLDCR